MSSPSISTGKLYTELIPKCCIDTLAFRFLEGFPLDRVRCVHGVTTKAKYHSNSRTNHIVSYNGVEIRVYVDYQIRIKTVHFNPSSFANFEHMRANFEHLFPEDLYQTSITRVDFTLDYPVVYEEFNQRIDVIGKQTNSAYENNARRGSASYSGVRPEVIKIYERNNETRVEIQQTDKKNPFRGLSMNKLLNEPKWITKHLKSKNAPFRNVILNKVQFDDQYKSLKDGKVNNYLKFEVLMKEMGLHFARKKIQKKHNFERDIKPKLQFIRASVQPIQAYQSGMSAWINSTANQITMSILELTSAELEEYEERASIIEYDSHIDRNKAELEAFQYISRRIPFTNNQFENNYS